MKQGMYHPFLIGKTVYLRGLEKDDLRTNYFQWFNDQEVTYYMYKGVYPNSHEAMEEYYNKVISSSNDVVLAIITKKGNKHIGNISLQNIDWRCRRADLGVIIGEKEYWGHGYSTEAHRLIIAYGFEQLNLNKIISSINAENMKAIIISKKLGFAKEGLLRNEIYRNGRYYDVYYMGLLREQYFKGLGQQAKAAKEPS